jgi:hypothetical protein
MGSAPLDLSHGAPKVYALTRQTASSHFPIRLADVALIVRGII